jgi:hypothetical protein
MSTQLTQLITVKNRLKLATTDTTDDAILTNAINAVSARITNDSNRLFDYQASAQFQFRGDEMDIRVDRYPIVSIALWETKQTEALGWVAASPTPDCVIGPNGSVIELAMALADNKSLARVTYAGGYILPGGAAVGGVPALPDDLEQAVVEQTVYWYQRRTQLGLVSMSGDGGSISQYKNLDFLPNVAAIIRKYERLVF